MINILLSSIQRTLIGIQKAIMVATANWPISLLALGTGLTFEEIYYGFRLIKFLGII